METNTVKEVEPFAPYLNSYIFEKIFSKIVCFATEVRFLRGIPEFKDDVVREWLKRDYSSTIGPSTRVLDMLKCNTDYKFFMRVMAPHFKRFQMYEDGNGIFPTLVEYISHIRKMGIRNLPSVEHCVLIGNPELTEDPDIFALSVMMPNVKKLKVFMNITGRYLDQFTKLEELYLYTRYFPLKLEVPIIQNICLKMHTLRILDIRCPMQCILRLNQINLPNLEVLQLNLVALLGILPQVLDLPRLRVLGVMYFVSRPYEIPSDNTFQWIIHEKASTITGITINNHILQLSRFWDHKLPKLQFPKLKKIVFDNWSFREPFLYGHDFPKENIEILSCRMWLGMKPEYILQLLKEYPNLKDLRITHCLYGKPVLKRIEDLLATPLISPSGFVKKRPRLTIRSYCYSGRDVSEEELKFWKNNKYIDMKISKLIAFDLLDNAFEFEFE